MKLQNLTIIFLAIALPIILILAFYVGLQVDTARNKAKCNDYLINAAHETMVAFQLNTTNNKYSTVSDTKIRDIEAAINVFSSSLATSFGRTSASNSYIMTYVPALVMTLYDGYYIYSPTEKNWENNDGKWKDIPLKHELKSYVYYSREYKNGNKVLTINYSLDNYVVVYFYDKTQGTYESKSGYLEIIPNELEETGFINGLSDDTAKKYYNDAWEFTYWYNNIVNNMNYEDKEKLMINSNNSALPGETSKFNDEKYEVVRDRISSNLIPAMSIYGYEMPKLTPSDWDLIYNNVCFIAFMQKMPIGTTVYNNYTIAISTENKETANANDIYFVNTKLDETGNEVASGSYHRIWCPHLEANDSSKKIKGYNKTELKNNDKLKNVPACYYCMVRASDPKLEYAIKMSETQGPTYKIESRKSAYFTALANEKLKLIKPSDFVNGSAILGT